MWQKVPSGISEINPIQSMSQPASMKKRLHWKKHRINERQSSHLFGANVQLFKVGIVLLEVCMRNDEDDPWIKMQSWNISPEVWIRAKDKDEQ